MEYKVCQRISSDQVCSDCLTDLKLLNDVRKWYHKGNISFATSSLCEALIFNHAYLLSYCPYDAEDFAKCQKLLEEIPELKLRLNSIQNLNRSGGYYVPEKVWIKIVTHWNQIVEMSPENQTFF